MFRLDKLTQKAQEALQQAQSVAEKNESQVLFPLHLLIALAEEAKASSGRSWKSATSIRTPS